MFHAGEVHRIQPIDAPGADTKPYRPYLLLHDCPAEMGTAVFAYGTRQPTLLRQGGECVRVDRESSGFPHTGLTDATYFCPCRLVPIEIGALREKVGELGPVEMDRARGALRRSLGIGRGGSRRAAAGSWRGAFVRLSPFFRAAAGATFALVVTEPEYSKQRWYQHLVPLVEGLDGGPPSGYVPVEEPWLSALVPGMTRGHFAIPLIFSGSEAGRPAKPGHFTQVMATVADEQTLERLDAALVAYFDLAP